MKKIIYFVMLLIPMLANAENSSGSIQLNMQVMMQKAQEIQVCMQKVDQAKLQAYQQRGQQMSSEIKAMCTAGKRSEAATKLLSFSQEFAADSSIQEMRKCIKKIRDSMPELANMAKSYIDNNSEKHVCDN